MLELLQHSPYYLLACTALLGLVIGSFLNVVIYRLPIMMNREFTQQALEYLNEQGETDKAINRDDEPGFNLVFPNSSCPHCGHEIKAIENIPVLSFLLLGGKCSACKTKISYRYPAIELLTALASMLLAWHFGFSWHLLAALVFTYALIALSFIDWDTQLLPDNITLPLLWLGLVINSRELFISLENAVLGAALGYLSLWSVFWLYKLISGKEGMGYGDFKLMALLGAWMGWQFIPLIILLSSVTGSIIGGSILLLSKGESDRPIPFGPYIASAGWITFLWGQQIIDTYLGIAGI